MQLYAYSTESGKPEGDPLGNVTVTLHDSKANVTFTPGNGNVINETNFYLGESRLPTPQNGSGSAVALGSFPHQGEEGDLDMLQFTLDVSAYNFYIAAHGVICGHFTTTSPTSGPTPSPTISESPTTTTTQPTPSTSTTQPTPSISTTQPTPSNGTIMPTICVDSQTIVFEDFENYTNSWKGCNVTKHHEFSTFLGRFGDDMPTCSKNFRVPVQAGYITIEFLFYEIDFWCSCDHITVEICDTQVDLGKFTPGDRGYVEGEVDGITWSSNSLTGSNMMGFNGFNDQKHELKMTIPQRCYVATGGELEMTFNLTTSDLASGGVDDLNITAYELCGTDENYPDITGAPTALSQPSVSPTTASPTMAPSSPDDSTCTEARMIVFQDFEGAYDGSWIGAEVNSEYDAEFSQFLGRFGREQNRASKTFDVPQDAKSLTIEFLVYEIDAWEKRDRMIFVVGTTRLDLKEFGLRDPVNNPNNIYSVAGKASGISWHRKAETNSTNMGFSPAAKDQKHLVSVSVPARYYADTGTSFLFDIHALCASSVSYSFLIVYWYAF